MANDLDQKGVGAAVEAISDMVVLAECDADAIAPAAIQAYLATTKTNERLADLEARNAVLSADGIAARKAAATNYARALAAEARCQALQEALGEFGSSRVRDRIAGAVGCNYDLLHDALQAEVRAALSQQAQP